ncbi:hypothetical protein KH172YL63_12150 [Bacillus sp. KH172YL63]|nr:hypothetical protein KH172YL63_12150 [Bacillus sp. KH172YL63]
MHPLLLRSLKNRLSIEIIYLNERQQCTKRKISVKKIEENHILAYCFLRRDMRKFKIQDILAAYPHHESQDMGIS